MLPERGPGSEPGSVGNVWVLGLVQENLHNTSPGEFYRIFIKTGDSEARKGWAKEPRPWGQV